MNDNVYASPQSELVEANEGSLELASRWARLFASIIDGIIISIVTIPVMYFSGFFEQLTAGQEPSFLYSIFIAFVGLIVFFAVNFQLLSNNGQTVGKKLLGIKAVNADGSHAEMKDLVLKRYTVYFLPGYIPLIGGIFSLVNILFIFGKRKRCIHDIAANTIVIKAN